MADYSNMSDAELSALLATKVMGLNVIGIATCTHIEGEWNVQTTWSKDSSWASQQYVYLPTGHLIDCEACAQPADDIHGKLDGYSEISLKVVPFFASDIAAAMQVIDEMMHRGFRYVLRGNFQGDGLHVAQFDHQDWADANPLFQSPPCESRSRAICEAALNILEDKQ